VVITETAQDDLRRIIRELGLPADSAGRVWEHLRPLARFPDMGSPLSGRWSGSRFVLGPWSWMIIIYEHLRDAEVVAVTTIQDARRAASATSGS